jgi:excisionase family DNA binding protein
MYRSTCKKDFVKMSSPPAKEWLSVTEASERLGVHPVTVRRWAEAGELTCSRTPGGHRRFRASDIAAWLERSRGPSTDAPPIQQLVDDQKIIAFLQQELAALRKQRVPWLHPFDPPARQSMRYRGRRLSKLAWQYATNSRDRTSILAEGWEMGVFLGEECAEWEISAADLVKAHLFFHRSFMQIVRGSLLHHDAAHPEGLVIYRGIEHFLDTVMVASVRRYDDFSTPL